MKCSFTGCIANALFAPKICVPAKNVPAEIREWPSIILGLPCCLHHCQTFDLKENFKQPNARMPFTFAYGVWKVKNMQPDFDRAFVIPVALDSAEFANFEKIAEASKSPKQ